MKDDPDSINPGHYKTNAQECIDVMQEVSTPSEFRAHCRLTAFKYIWRAKQKGDEIENYRKARWYLSFACGEDPRKLAGTTPPPTPPEEVPWASVPAYPSRPDDGWGSNYDAILLRDLFNPGTVVECDEVGIVPEGTTILVHKHHDFAMSTDVLRHITGAQYKTTKPVNINYYLGLKR